MAGQPLTDTMGAIQWPFQGQRLLPDDYLFPGRTQDGRRAWRCPVTERAFLKHLRAGADYLAKERAKFRAEHRLHPCEDVDLAKLGTHSFKKTTVTTLKACKFSTALVSCITGTSTRTLDTTYDRPSAKRQRQAMAEALGPVIPVIAKTDLPMTAPAEQGPTSSSTEATFNYCPYCGAKRLKRAWHYCPGCGVAFG